MARNIPSVVRRWRLRVLALVAVCAVAAIPAAAMGAGKLRYIDIFEDLQDNPVDATTVSICWSGDHTNEAASWTIRRADGTTPPPADAPPVATVPGGTSGVCYEATGLVTDAPYTFRITGNDASGESEPATITVAAREPGNFVLSGDSSELLPGSRESGNPQLAVTSRDRRWHAVYIKFVPGATFGLYYSARGKAGWTEPELVTSGSSLRYDVQFASNANTLAVAWNSYINSPRSPYTPRYRVRRPGASRFGSRQIVPNLFSGDNADALAVDRRGHLHMLLERPGDYPHRGLLYLTNASGRWRQAPIPKSVCPVTATGCALLPLLAYDAVRDRIVAIAQYKGVRIAGKRASARKLGAFRPLVAANERHLVATGLTSRAGRTTVGLQTKTGFVAEDQKGPLYVIAGGRLMQVPDTTERDTNLRVAASSGNRVHLAWQRSSATWDVNEQGIWTAELVRNRKTGRWSIGSIRQRTVSHYDYLSSLTVDARGRALAAYVR